MFFIGCACGFMVGVGLVVLAFWAISKFKHEPDPEQPYQL